jgi:ABC-type branched-subunit amino acid transport system ATPase component
LLPDPAGGEIRFREQPITSMPAGRIARLGIGRTFQHVKLLPEMSVLDNVAIGAHLRGHAGFLRCLLHLERREERRIRAEAARQLERVGLKEEMFLPAGSLPLGKQRIVEVARALAADPVLLLLDEPAAGLRYLEKQALGGLLRQLRSDGVSVLLVEHDMDFVMGLVDRLVVLDFGIKLAEGLPREIQERSGGARSLPGRRGVTAQLLSATAVSVFYGRVEAVHGVSLRVDAGQIVTVIGANGAGKTTLLSALMGLLPARGDVSYLGQQLEDEPPESRVARGLALVPERRELFGDMSVADNLLLGAFHRRRDPRVAPDLETVYGRFPKLRDRRAQLAATLSGGERQMLALGRALMSKPRLLLLDEPSQGWRLDRARHLPYHPRPEASRRLDPADRAECPRGIGRAIMPMCWTREA